MPLQSSNLKHQALLLVIGLYWTYSYWITLIPTLVYLFWIGQNLLHSPKVKGLNDFDLIVFTLYCDEPKDSKLVKNKVL